MNYTQCKIKRNKIKQTAWLQADKVKLNRFITLKDSESPELKWQIIKIFSTTNEDNIKDSHNSKRWFENDCFIKFGNK